MKKGFTLSEVLITLGVIGVVAAITLPTFIKNYQKHVTINKLKQTYSTLERAITRAYVDYGDASTWDNIGGTNRLSQEYRDNLSAYLNKYLFPNLRVSKDLGISYNKPYVIYGYDGVKYSFTQPNNLNIVSNSINITVDINGDKRPNKAGKDIFLLILSGGKIRGGCFNNENNFVKKYCSTTNSDKRCCFEYIFRNNWKMPDDYPW